jgi:trimeric autotransporter adhesin
VLALALPAAATAAPSNGTTGNWTLIGSPSVSAMERLGDVVYMAGRFKGIARRAPRVAALDAQSGQLATALTDRDPSSGSVTAVAPTADGGAYLAGAFTSAGGVPQRGLLRYAPNGTLDEGFRPQIDNGDISDIELGPNGIVYVAGTFTSAGGRQRFGLAAFNPSGSLAGWDPKATNAAGGPAAVSEIEIGQNSAYVAGTFQRIGGGTPAGGGPPLEADSRPGLAEISLSTPAATDWNPQPNGPVSSIAISGSTVYLGGPFTRVRAGPTETDRQFLAAVSTAGVGNVLAWDPRPNSAPNSIAIQGSTVYVGGPFSRIGTPAVNQGKIAALDATSGQPLPGWSLRLDNVISVDTILPAGDRIYLGCGNDVFPPAVAGVRR